MPPFTDQQRLLITTLADCDLRLSKTAQVLGWHRNTLGIRMDKILRQTGLDPRRFRDLCQLMERMVDDGK